MVKTKKLILALILSLALVGSQAISVFALDDLSTSSQEDNNQAVEEEKEQPKEEKAEEEAQTAPTEENKDEPASDENTTTGESSDSKAENSEQTKPSSDAKDEEDSETEKLTDGTYKPDEFTFTGGTGKLKITCDKVVIKGGDAFAELQLSSKNYTKLKVKGVTYAYKLVDAKAVFNVPVEINKEFVVTGTTTAMSTVRDIDYTLHIKLSDKAVKSSDSTDFVLNDIINTEPENPNPGHDDPTSGQENPVVDKPTQEDDPIVEPKDTTKLADGTYMILAKANYKMFKLQPDSTGKTHVKLVKKGSKLQVTVILTGHGYDYLYVGTAKQAAKAKNSNWIKYKKTANDYYTYTFNISSLDKNIAVASHSQKYDRWYDRNIIFYSKGAKKMDANMSLVPTKKNVVKPRNNTKNTYAKNNASTSAVNNSTKLKDGTYSVDKFSWSGGSGRLAYIKCTKITVRGGKAYGTIVFSSPHYDKLKANGTVYSNRGSANSTFEIPIKLNSNNTIIGRTTAMSSPHWITYNIYIYSAAAAKAGDGGDASSGDSSVDKNKLSDEAPEIIGLTYESTTEVEHSELFKIFNYEGDIALVQVDMDKASALKYEDAEDTNGEQKVEYDENNKPIAKSDNETTTELYKNKVVNFLVVPEDAELPAGIEKECVIIKKPVKKIYTTSKEVTDILKELSFEEVTLAKDSKIVKYTEILKNNTDLAILDESAIPSDKEKDEKIIESKKAELEDMEMKFSTLSVPLIVDRSQAEKDEKAQLEWIKVFGAILGNPDDAETMFKTQVDKLK